MQAAFLFFLQVLGAAVVDRAGVVRALLREDGAGPHTVASSRKKAYTAASLKRPTAELAELIAKMPAVQGLRDMNDHILILGGGLPIIMAGEIVGGIGVGGAPGGHLECGLCPSRVGEYRSCTKRFGGEVKFMFQVGLVWSLSISPVH